MPLDHSLTYRTFSVKNIPHRLRLAKIFKEIDALRAATGTGTSYLDIGCSNGFITDIVRQKYSFSRVVGLDHNLENLQIAQKKYPNIEFGFIDLNASTPPSNEKFELVSCFETLEHVGNLENAVSNILEMTKRNGSIIITVPIEVKGIGIFKFLAKTIIYRYKLTELTPAPSWGSYLSALLKGDISRFREPRAGWGTHFGFDYRQVDAILAKKEVAFIAHNSLTTRFYIIRKNN